MIKRFIFNVFRLDAVAAIAALHQHQPFKSYIGAEIPAPPPPPHAAPSADPSSGGGGSPYVTQHVRTSSGGILIKRSTAAAAASLPRTTAAYHDVSSGILSRSFDTLTLNQFSSLTSSVPQSYYTCSQKN